MKRILTPLSAATSRVALAVLAMTFAGCALAQQPVAPEVKPVNSVPYVWRNVRIGGGGFVTGIIPHPRERGLIYARTDVGGAYRWDPAARRWIPITDWIGMADVNLTGIESVALDPADPDRVYLAAGTYSSGPAAILRSNDRGRTFERTDVPFPMGGNEMGRFNGERLAVDPNLGEILFFGSRRDGLWRSADRGATWRKVESFPDIGTAPAPDPAARRRRFGFPPQPVGIVSVVFDSATGKPGSPTPALYAAVSTTESNLWRSLDAGATWQLVADRPIGLCPNHVVPAPDGLIYLTYGKEPGPNTMTDGAVWKFDPRTGAWTDITPLKPATADQTFGYGGVAVDAQDSRTIIVSTFCHWKPMDEIFRSTNGGAAWTPLLEQAEWDHSPAPYTSRLKPHWIGDVEINPFDRDQVLFVTGYGIWSSRDVTEADAGHPTHWVFFNDGLEETVPLALVSPAEGVHLLSGVGDVDGFRHEDLNVAPPGAFDGPRYSNTEDMALAGQKPGVVVRCGTSRTNEVRAAISTDGGRTWSALGSEPTGSQGAGNIAVSADGRTIVWTPRRGEPHYTTNLGAKWTACAGLSPGLRVVADAVNPLRFYAYDARVGKLFASTDGAATFTNTAAAFPAAEGFPGGFGGGGGDGGKLYTIPGGEGGLWLAFRNGGLHHSADGGTTFVMMGEVQEAYSLGFGRAAPGQNHPALFLAGKVGGLQALFRSDDAGATWMRINDDQHQFGWLNHVTGDPRLFGRVYFATGGRGVIYGEPAAAGE